MLTVLLLLGVGVVLARTGAVPPGTDRALDRIVVAVSLPGLVVATLPSLALDADALVPVAVAWAQLVVLVVVVWLVARWADWPPERTGAMLLCVPLGNTSFLGVPAVDALLGPQHVPYAIVYDQLGSFLALATWGTVVAARYGDGERPNALGMLRRVVTFPPFVALVVALGARWTGLPTPVEELASTLGATLVPLTMIAIGLRLRVPEVAARAPLAIGLGLRLVAAPLAVLAVARLVGGEGVAWDTTVLESGMPPMVTAGVVATAAGLEERLATALTAGGILVALLTLPLLAAAIG